eukprot:scaffold1875_cov253-Pinguiococcus_pyrenoidosus.AAC.30
MGEQVPHLCPSQAALGPPIRFAPRHAPPSASSDAAQRRARKCKVHRTRSAARSQPAVSALWPKLPGFSQQGAQTGFASRHLPSEVQTLGAKTAIRPSEASFDLRRRRCEREQQLEQLWSLPTGL